jgi:hypothetical protein
MALSKRSKRSSGVTSLASSKALIAVLLLTAPCFFWPGALRADAGIVSATGSGKEISEAIVALLRSVMARHFSDVPAQLSKNIFQNEIAPNAASFVQSYRILEGGRGSAVSLTANVDLEVIRSLFALSPKGLDEPAGAKALVVVKGARLPDAVVSAGSVNPYSVLESYAQERLGRRGFDVVVVGPDELQALGMGEDVAGPEFLRALGARAGARVAVGISSRSESAESEGSQAREQRLVVTSTMVDMKAGVVLGRASITVSEPRGRRDQYAADLQKTLAEDGRALFHETFVAAGKKVMKVPGQQDYSLVRVQSPPSAVVVTRFRGLLESARNTRSVVEHGAGRGYFDLAVRPAMKPADLAVLMRSLPAEDMNIVILEPLGFSAGERPPELLVRLVPREAAAEDSGGSE